eukprot:5226668-Prymnesium_polylepis.1
MWRAARWLMDVGGGRRTVGAPTADGFVRPYVKRPAEILGCVWVVTCMDGLRYLSGSRCRPVDNLRGSAVICGCPDWGLVERCP